MAFDRLVGDASVRADLTAGLTREWDRLARPGTWWTATERIALAQAVRRHRPVDVLDSTVVDAVAALAHRPASIRRRWVESLVASGLDYPRYIELVGVVSRVAAVDAFLAATSHEPEPLPSPLPGEPSRNVPPQDARRGKAWVPMVGGVSITQALSLVPAEADAQTDLHAALYLSHQQMADVDFTRGLHRTQMELIAARTSAINECFY